MAKKTIANIVAELARPIVDENGLDLWDISFEKEGSNWYLRILLDCAERPITIEDCEAVSRPLSDKLDEADPITQSYFLEVSSPGLGRRLRTKEHLLASVGRPVEVKLIRPQDGVREFYGVISSAKENNFSLDTEEGVFEFSLGECSYVKWADDLDLLF